MFKVIVYIWIRGPIKNESEFKLLDKATGEHRFQDAAYLSRGDSQTTFPEIVTWSNFCKAMTNIGSHIESLALWHEIRKPAILVWTGKFLLRLWGLSWLRDLCIFLVWYQEKRRNQHWLRDWTYVVVFSNLRNGARKTFAGKRVAMLQDLLTTGADLDAARSALNGLTTNNCPFCPREALELQARKQTYWTLGYRIYISSISWRRKRKKESRLFLRSLKYHCTTFLLTDLKLVNLAFINASIFGKYTEIPVKNHTRTVELRT